MQHQMYNVQIKGHFHFDYRCIITINLFDNKAHDMK